MGSKRAHAEMSRQKKESARTPVNAINLGCGTGPMAALPSGITDRHNECTQVPNDVTS